MMYEYKAIVTDVYDGDTITVDIDLGLGVWLRGQKVRLKGINAPEVRGDTARDGQRVRSVLVMLIWEREVIIRTEKDRTEKYGRWLATVILEDRNINEWMVENVDGVVRYEP